MSDLHYGTVIEGFSVALGLRESIFMLTVYVDDEHGDGWQFVVLHENPGIAAARDWDKVRFPPSHSWTIVE